LCNLSPLICSATGHHSAILRLGHHSFVPQFITTQLFCNFPLGCSVICPSVVMQLVTTRLFSNLLPLSCSETCHRSVPQFITTHLFRNLPQLGCCATSHHAFVLQLVTTQPFCNLSLIWCPTCRSVVVQLVTQLFCKLFTCFALLSLVC